MAAGDNKNPYAVDNDPMRGARNPLQSDRIASLQPPTMKQKNRKSLEDAANEEDPISNAVRSLWLKVRGK
jgi:hypothetical protein